MGSMEEGEAMDRGSRVKKKITQRQVLENQVKSAERYAWKKRRWREQFKRFMDAPLKA